MPRKHRRTYPNLSRYLEATGQTQQDLAATLGVSQGYISKLVRGLQEPSLKEALRIADLIGVPVESLLARESDIPAEQS